MARAAGADYWFSPDTVAGFALAGGGSNFSVANGGSGRSDLFQAGAFVRHNFGATYLTAVRSLRLAGCDHGSLCERSQASIICAPTSTSTHTRAASSWAIVSSRRGSADWACPPYAAAQITAFELPSYTERASFRSEHLRAELRARITPTSSRTELGLRTDKSFALEGAVLTLRGRAAWAHDFNPDRAVAATFQSLPGASFIVNGAALASDAALATASAEVRWLNGWSVAGTFEGEFSDVTRSYAGKGVVRL